MDGDQSAYAVLGLEPGAEPAAVERAYKSLIKEYHPDRSGGDPVRAAELNRANRELRARSRIREEMSLHPLFPAHSAGWSRTAWAVGLLLILGAAAVLLPLLSPNRTGGIEPSESRHGDRIAAHFDQMKRPLNLKVIGEAVVEAVRLSRQSDEMRLAATSRDCHRTLRMTPNIEQFDRCAAFDNAVIRLQDRDPLRDKGNFSQIAVTGRLFSAAAAISGDYMATDSRMERIRVEVELLLTPAQSRN